MRRDPDRIRRSPDFSTLEPILPRFPKRRHPIPRWIKIALGATGITGLVLLARMDFGTGQAITGKKPAQEMLSVELPPPAPPKPEMPQDLEIPSEALPTPDEVPQMPSMPSVGVLQESEAGGAGTGLPGPALDLGIAAGRGGMAVGTGGGGHGGGTGTGVGSGSGSGTTASRFTYNPGETDTDPQLVSSSDPTYPRRAREDGLEPRVELRILVDERGRVEQVEVQGAPAGYGFEAVVRTAVSQWRFQPATKGGVPVRTWVSQGYQFRLN